MSNPEKCSASTTPASAPDGSSRRSFIKTSTAGMVGGALVGQLGPLRAVHAAGNDTLRIGLIGCGGRGRGAAMNALRADPNLKLVALADAFEDQALGARDTLREQTKGEDMAHKFDVGDDHCFHGFDAYQKLIDSGVDVVLLATTPHFRPQQLKAAIEAGKHVFCEKPVAVDGPGIRSVLETTEVARAKKLNIVSGLCWRYHEGVVETCQRILDGAIGDVQAIQCNYLTGTLWHRGRKPEWSEMEYQMRNWLYFTWLSGDHIVEQHIHSLDKALWLNGDQLPTRCFGLGGRQVRTGEQWGNIYDHHAVCFEYEATGVKVYAYTRQMSGCYSDVDDYVIATRGKAQLIKNRLWMGDEAWRFDPRKAGNMYDNEHVALFSAIRKGEPINNGVYMARSTAMAIMGREACYTGRSIESEELLSSNVRLGPDTYAWGDVPKEAVAMPGVS